MLGFGGTHFTAPRLNRSVVVAKLDIRICGYAIDDQSTSIFGSPFDIGCNHCTGDRLARAQWVAPASCSSSVITFRNFGVFIESALRPRQRIFDKRRQNVIHTKRSAGARVSSVSNVLQQSVRISRATIRAVCLVPSCEQTLVKFAQHTLKHPFDFFHFVFFQ